VAVAAGLPSTDPTPVELVEPTELTFVVGVV
jgi:hypothetical protein